MTQTSNRFFDEMARLMNDAAGVAQGVRREFDTLVRTQAERILRDLDVVKREEFEAVKEMARLAREENEALAARVAALEAAIGKAGTCPPILVFPPSSRYKPRDLGMVHPWRPAGRNGRGSGRLRCNRTRGFGYGDRQGDQGDGASAGR